MKAFTKDRKCGTQIVHRQILLITKTIWLLTH